MAFGLSSLRKHLSKHLLHSLVTLDIVAFCLWRHAPYLATACDTFGRHLSRSGCGTLHTTAAEDRTKEGIYQHSGLFRPHSIALWRPWGAFLDPLDLSSDDPGRSRFPSSAQIPQWHKSKDATVLLEYISMWHMCPASTCSIADAGFDTSVSKSWRICLFYWLGFFFVGCQLTSHPIW